MLTKVRTITCMVCLALLMSAVTAQTQGQQRQRRGRARLDDNPAAWTYLAQGNVQGSVELDDSTPLNDDNPQSLKLTVTEVGRPENGDRCGIVNDGVGDGMNVREGQWYDFTFSAYAEENRSVGLVFALEGLDGTICARVTIPEIGRGMRGFGRRGGDEGPPPSPWRQYRLSLQAYNSNPQCRLIIKPIEPVTMYLSDIRMSTRGRGGNRSGARRGNAAPTPGQR